MARKIRIYLDKYDVAWDDFIATMDEIGPPRSIPVALQNHKEDRFGDGHKFLNLLRAFKGQQCSEVRDKIFGFVGLATDCGPHFPMSYDKSLFEVWKDAVCYLSGGTVFSEPKILGLAKLMKNLLGGDSIATAEDLAFPEQIKSEDHIMIHVPELSVTVKVPIFVAGHIDSIGPSHAETVSDPLSPEAWNANLRVHCQARELPLVFRTSDDLWIFLESTDESDLRWITSWDPPFVYKDEKQPWPERPAFSPPLPVPNQAGGNRVFLLNRAYSKGQHEPRRLQLDNQEHGHRLLSRIGLCPAGAEIGDLICYTYDSPTAIVVRPGPFESLTLLGTAAIAKCHSVDEEDSQRGEKVGQASSHVDSSR